MKDKKRFLLVFAICWIVGITGGYLLGVGSAILPSDDISYSYYFSENTERSDVEQIEKSCGEESLKEATQDEEADDSFYIIIKSVGIFQIPKKLLDQYLK